MIIKKSIQILFITYCLFHFFNASGQHTFSICAVDTVTREVGSAGADTEAGDIEDQRVVDVQRARVAHMLAHLRV